MSTGVRSSARLNFRLPANLKSLIERAAAERGQSVSDFAVATLVQGARTVLQETAVTELTNRDRDLFMAMLDDASAQPNKALRDAARRYKKRTGQSRTS